MQKKIGVFAIVVIMAFFAVSCGQDEQVQTDDNWLGKYVMLNEETEEIKILTVDSETEEGVTLRFESVRSKDEFSGTFKSSSGKYAVCNTGERCLKFSLKSSDTVISVDDIWTDSEHSRNENWSGKYVVLEEGEIVGSFGNSDWNGRYVNGDTGIELGIYGIRPNLVLVTYTVPDSESGEKVNIKCRSTDDEPYVAKSYETERRVELKLHKKAAVIDISDTIDPDFVYEKSDEENESDGEGNTAAPNVDLSGKYKRIK